MGKKSNNWHGRAHLLHHLAIAITISLDLIIVALSVITENMEILLPADSLSLIWQSRLPQFASFAGSLIASLNGYCVYLIATSWAKRAALTTGFTLRAVDGVAEVANGGMPLIGINPLLFLALLILALKSFISSALVGSLTPTNFLVPATLSYSTPEFSSASGIPASRCVYGSTYGYGQGCPLNTAFGVIYDASLPAFTGSLPLNLTRDGVTYPATLSGISGSISTLTRTASTLLSADPNRAISGRDQVQACMPRLRVNTTCQGSLRAGYEMQTVVENTPTLGQPESITEIKLCKNGGSCFFSNTAPDYTYGVIVVFGQTDVTTGATSVFILSTGKYPNDLSSSTIECNVTATEELVPITITSGTFLSIDQARSCPTRPQPDPAWLTNVTFIAQMTLQKQQGQDGRLEAVALLQKNSTVTPLRAMEIALTRMVSVGATEMYAEMEASSASGSEATGAAFVQTITYSTPRNRLGAPSAVYWTAAPAIMGILLLFGWMRWAWSWHGGMYFSPLNAISMAAAGMNSIETPPVIAQQSACDPRRLGIGTADLKFRFGVVAPGRLGLSTRTGDEVLPPSKGMVYDGPDVGAGAGGFRREMEFEKPLLDPYAASMHSATYPPLRYSDQYSPMSY